MQSKEYYKKYYKQNKKRLIKKHKIYYKKHKRKIKQYHKQYYWKNYKQINTNKKKYFASPQGIYCTLNTNAKKRNIKICFSKAEFINWHNNQNKICFYCKLAFKDISKRNFNKRYKRLTIDRKEPKKSYTLHNIVLACIRCNFIKSNYFTVKEMLKIGKIINKKEV